MKKLLYLCCLPLQLLAQFSNENIAGWQQQAQRITIIRDNWGVPHIYGKKDADCAFGVMYAQCEDNYRQLEETFIPALGRAAELYGENRLQNDVSVALFECVKRAKNDYANASLQVKELCKSAAAGINYYSYKHPDTLRRLLHYYEPWFFLLPGTDNPSGHGITGAEVRSYNNTILPRTEGEGEDNGIEERENGSNTMAIAPSKSASGYSLLLINPHVNFFGNGQRYECHLISEQGLNVSGFTIFGNFYIWSGFNAYSGWAHTNSGVDFTDVYLERFDHPTDPTQYRYGKSYRKATVWHDTVHYKTPAGLQSKVVLLRKTHHGPVVAKRDSLLVAIKNVTGTQSSYIEQCWKMCRSKKLKQFMAAMNKRALGYPNTMYADKYGNTAYWHGNAVAKRSTRFNWRFPVDGSDPATEWKGLHRLKDIVHVINPASGWIQNCNSTPYLAAGAISSPRQSDYPDYMAYDKHIFRAVEAVRLLSAPEKISFTDFEKLVVSNHLPMMAAWLPQILQAYDSLAAGSPALKEKLSAVADTLRRWNYRYSLNSKATSIAVMWYLQYDGWNRSQPRQTATDDNATDLQGNRLPMPGAVAVDLLDKATDALIARFGTAFVSWGDINRLQRGEGSPERFDDNKPSWPVAAVPSPLGSLFAFGNGQTRGQQKFYGTRGNTYTSIVEFGPRVRARSIMYFGQSANPSSPHYLDQAPLYVEGTFKDAWFYKEDILKHAEKTYHPGE